MSSNNYGSSSESSNDGISYEGNKITFQLTLTDTGFIKDPVDCNAVMFPINYIGTDNIMIQDQARCNINAIVLGYGSSVLQEKVFTSYLQFMGAISPQFNRTALATAIIGNLEPGPFLEVSSMNIHTVTNTPLGLASFSVGNLVKYIQRPNELMVVCGVRQTLLHTNQYLLAGENSKVITRIAMINGRALEIEQWVDQGECFPVWIDETPSLFTTA